MVLLRFLGEQQFVGTAKKFGVEMKHSTDGSFLKRKSWIHGSLVEAHYDARMKVFQEIQ